jgi:TRAP-type mannitol/chloroaromatic compound transport system permease small subunit
MTTLARLAHLFEQVNERLGRIVSWLALALVMVQFTVVVMRYVFGVSSIIMQESLLYLHGMLFMLAAGYTFLHDGHVRVDIFYREAGPRRRALVDLIGALVFLAPFCITLWALSWPYVAASWAVREGSAETSGIAAVYLLKSIILLFTGLIALAGAARLMRCILTLAGHQPPPAAGADEEIIL